MMKRLVTALLLLVVCAAAAHGQEGISDNSFLVEEAYNQDPGVVQHTNAFMRMRGGDWAYTFTQEWPVANRTHQLSFTVPLLRFRGSRRAAGDVALHYRYQLVGNSRVGVAPRLSLLLPTGSVQERAGAGGAGFQFNLPVTVRHSGQFVTHWNAGATFTPRARNAEGNRAGTVGHNLGQSVVWRAHPRFNALFETVWARAQTVEARGARGREYSMYVNPGVRWSHDFSNGLQVVPGVSVPVGAGPSRGGRGVLFYLSFEHPFRKGR